MTTEAFENAKTIVSQLEEFGGIKKMLEAGGTLTLNSGDRTVRLEDPRIIEEVTDAVERIIRDLEFDFSLI